MRTAPGTDDAGRTVVRIDYDDASGPLIQTSVSGTLQPATARTLRQALGYSGHDAGHHRPHPLARAAAVAQARALSSRPRPRPSIVTR